VSIAATSLLSFNVAIDPTSLPIDRPVASGLPAGDGRRSEGCRSIATLKDKSEVARDRHQDTSGHKLMADITGRKTPSGMGFDAEASPTLPRLHNKIMVMAGQHERQVVATVPIGDRVDGNSFDPGLSSPSVPRRRHRHHRPRESPDKLTVVQTLTTEHGARTMALDPRPTRFILLPPSTNRNQRRPRHCSTAPKIIPAVSKSSCTVWTKQPIISREFRRVDADEPTYPPCPNGMLSFIRPINACPVSGS